MKRRNFLEKASIVTMGLGTITTKLTANKTETTKENVNIMALVIVDPFNDFIAEGGKRYEKTKEILKKNKVVENLVKLSSTARVKGIKVAYAPHHRPTENSYRDWKYLNPSHKGIMQSMVFEKGTWGGQYHKDLQPQPLDIVSKEHMTVSGFANTDLDFLLRINGIEKVAITGMLANTCVEATARYAVEMGYHVTMISDAIGAYTWDEMEASLTINYPRFAHEILSTEEYLKQL